MLYEDDIVIASCDIGNTVAVNIVTGELKILDQSSSWIVTISVDQKDKLVMIGGSNENNFRIYDLSKADGEQHVLTFVRKYYLNVG